MNKNNENDKFFDNDFWKYISIFAVIIILISFFPYWLTSDSIFERGFSHTGEIGDTIGGIMGPFIAIIASFLTFIAFWAQYKSNKKQTEQFRLQANDMKIERFENKYYEMIKIHRDNVSEISINKGIVIKRKAFISMFLELKCAYYILKKLIDIREITNIKEEEDIINIAYVAFFTGVGENSDKVAKELLKDYNINDIEKYFKKLKYYKNEYNKEISVPNTDLNTADKFYSTTRKQNEITIEYNNEKLTFSKYLPFNGHMSRLGHYYRHLFQTVKYVVNQDFDLDLDEQALFNLKYQYLKTLRAQLSDYELLMLYYNGCSVLGKKWFDNKYLTTWRFLKNIPTALADFGEDPNKKMKITQ